MAANYFSLPQYNPGREADFSGINNALENIRNQNNIDRQRADVMEQRDYQRGRDAKVDARAAEAANIAKAQRVGQIAMSYDQFTDPAQRQAGLNRILQMHPNAASLGPEYRDPATAFKLIAADAGAYDPRAEKVKDLEIRKIESEIAKNNRTDSSTGYGKNGAVVQGPDGNYYAVRYGADGTERINPLQIGGQTVTPAKGVSVVGDTMYNTATGQTVKNVSSALSGGEQAKAQGRAIGEGVVGLPKARVALEQYNAQEATVQGSIDKALSQADGWTTGLTGAAMSNIPGTAAHNLANTLNTIKSNLGFDKLQAMRDASPTGGALGQVSEMENRLLQSVWGAIEQSQTKEQLVENLQNIKNIRARFAQLKQQAYEEDVKRFGAAAVPNPETGAKPATSSAPSNPYVDRYGLEK